MRIAITGASGMLGSALVECCAANHVVCAASRRQGLSLPGVEWTLFDLTETAAVKRWLSASRPDVVIHNAAMVSVDGCEREPHAAAWLHSEVVNLLAEETRRNNASLVYISTDSVFNGRAAAPYGEDAEPHPLNVYATTKHAGEQATLAEGGLVLRTNIFGWSPTPRLSFAEWVLKGLVSGERLTMFTDVHYTPIHVHHLAGLLLEALQLSLRGVFHAGGSTVLSKHAFALRLAQAFGLDPAPIVATSIDAGGLVAERPKNMALSTTRLATALGHVLPDVDQGIARFKWEYDSGWLARLKQGTPGPGYRFWEAHA